MSISPDTINAAFELFGAVVITLNIRRVLKDKIVRGFDWRVLAFFTLWGFWNLYYYPHLERYLSFVAGIFIVGTNSIYLALLLYFTHKEKTENLP